MNPAVYVYGLIVISLLLSNIKAVVADSKLTSELPLTEAYVELMLESTFDNFYRVMQDTEESPYLALATFANYWLQMEGGCDADGCVFYLPEDGGNRHEPYLINFFDASCSKPNSDEIAIQLKRQEGQYWIHWQSVTACFPVTGQWDLDLYILKMQRQYYSLSDLVERINLRRNTDKEKALHQEALLAQQEFLPDSIFSFTSRLKSSADFVSDDDNSFDWRGDSFLRYGNHSLDLSYALGEVSELDYVQYHLAKFKYGYQLQLGHVTLQSSVANKARTFDEGFNYSRLQPLNLPGNISIERRTEANIFIDVYVNDIYRGTVSSDDSGRYSIENFQLSAGDLVSFQELIRPGIIVKNSVRIATLEDELLPKGEFDIQLGGDFGDSDMALARFEYGFNSNTTVINAAYKGLDGNYLGFGLRWLPVHFATIATEWLPEFDALPVQIELLFSAHQGLSLLLNQKDVFSQSINSEPKQQLNYHFNASPFSYNIDAEMQGEELLVSPKAKLQIRASDYLSLVIDNKRNASQVTNAAEMSYLAALPRYGDITVSSRVSDSDIEPVYKLGYRYQCNNCFLPKLINTEKVAYAFGYHYQGGENSFSGSVAVDVNQYLSSQFKLTDDSVSLQLEGKIAGRAVYRDGALTTQALAWKNYLHSQVVGQVVDQNQDGVANVKLQINNQKVSTDEQGYFTFYDVSYGGKMQLHILESSLDLALKPTINPILFSADKAGVTKVEVVLHASFGVDGVISDLFTEPQVANAAISVRQWQIYFTNNDTGQTHIGRIEDDGFYLLEELSTGSYQIRIDNGLKQYETHMNLESNDWISGLDFHVNKGLHTSPEKQ